MEIFSSVDTDNDGKITLEEIDVCLNKLKSDIAGEELHDFFDISAVSVGGQDNLETADKKLNHKEFLVALVICYILRAIPMLATPLNRRKSIDGSPVNPKNALVAFPSESRPKLGRKASISSMFRSKSDDGLRESFDLMVHAYLLFDKEAKGYIVRSDVANMMKEDGAGNGQVFLQEERWAEMDSNDDGVIEFSEFIYSEYFPLDLIIRRP